MRQYTKYSGRPAPKRFRGGFAWVLLALATGAVGWIWWQQQRWAQPTPQRSASTPAPVRPSPTPPRPATTSATNLLRTALPQTTNAPLRPGAGTPLQPQPSPSPATTTATVTNTPAATPIPSEMSAQPVPSGFPRLPLTPFEIQVSLARRLFAPGSIDGVMGQQTRSALQAFQEAHGLPATGQADAATRARLTLSAPVERRYQITEADLARLTPIGRTWRQKSQQDRLDYETILELVAERGHAHPALIRSWNRSIDWNRVLPNTWVSIPDVSYTPATKKAVSLRIRLREKTLHILDAAGQVSAHFPCSIAQRMEKRPIGLLSVETIAPNPNYRFNPDIFPESDEARRIGRPLMLPPGPNNPVGTAWIGLSKPGYGIHGTPRPEDVGRTESHGCFRLANWDAEYLVESVAVGTPVKVEP